MIKELHIKNFTRFSDNTFHFSDGINVFLGKNSMGKTHLLKLLACSLKAVKENGEGKLDNGLLSDKLKGYFKPDKLGRLVKRSQGRNKAEVQIKTTKGYLSFDFATSSNNVKIEQYDEIENLSSLYLPPREIISVFEGFSSLYLNREVGFDETYYQLALSLALPLFKGRRYDDIDKLIAPLEQETGYKIVKEEGRFYFKNSDGKMEMSLVAEGYRKIATLMYLIANGEITQHSVLFWDEPEANLNPALTKVVVDILLTLANNGVQIFLASHDYLLTNLLSLQSEYKDLITKKKEKATIKFFGLYEEDGTLVFDSGDTLTDLSHNAILEEFVAFYDLEKDYFNRSLHR